LDIPKYDDGRPQIGTGMAMAMTEVNGAIFVGPSIKAFGNLMNNFQTDLFNIESKVTEFDLSRFSPDAQERIEENLQLIRDNAPSMHFINFKLKNVFT
jgi:hypothetical protein